MSSLTVKWLLCALAGCVFSDAALAATSADSDVPKLLVRYDDLNLSSTSGVRTLWRRIHNAAETVCAEGGDTRDLRVRLAYTQCVNQAAHVAVEQVHWPEVSDDAP
jgi:UrcA family protein